MNQNFCLLCFALFLVPQVFTVFKVKICKVKLYILNGDHMFFKNDENGKILNITNAHAHAHQVAWINCQM